MTRRTDRRRALARLGIVSAALLLFLACGDDPAPIVRANPASAESERPPAELAAETHSDAVSPRRILAPRPEGNAAPIIHSVRFEPERPAPGGSVRAKAEASDPDGDPVELSYTWRLDGKLVRVSGESLALTEARKGDTVEVTVAAGDGRAVSAPHVLSVQLHNRAPKVKALRLVPEDGVPPGGRVLVVAEVSDPDGDDVQLAYTWFVNGNMISDDGAKLQTPVRSGDWVSVRVVASDGEDEAEPFELPEVEIENAAPWIVSEPGATGPDGVFRYQVSAEDVDNHLPLRFSLGQAPEGMTVDERTGLVEWSPGGEQSGTHRIEIAVHDSQGASGTQSFDLVVGGDEAVDGAARQGG